MKVSLIQLSLDTNKIYVPEFDCDVNDDRDGPSATDQHVHMRPDAALQPHFKSNQYQLPSILFDRPLPIHIPLISIEHLLAWSKKHEKNWVRSMRSLTRMITG